MQSKKREEARKLLNEHLKYNADDCTVYHWDGKKIVAIEARCLDWTRRAQRLFMMLETERCFVLPAELGYIMTDLQKADYIEHDNVLYRIVPGTFTEGCWRFMPSDFLGTAWAYFALAIEKKI